MLFKKSSVIEQLNKKSKQWAYEHPMSGHSTPWSSIYLKDEKNESGLVWLNPDNQKYVPYGWMSEEQLYSWLNEDDSFLLKDYTFAELKEHCEVGYLMGTHMEQSLPRNNHPAHNIKTFSRKALKGVIDNKMNEGGPYYSKKFNATFIKELEGHLKQIIEEYFMYSSFETIVKNNFRISSAYSDRIYYFLSALSKVGIGGWEYSNTPKERENFSFLRDYIQTEVQKEVYTHRRIRRYKDYYLDINVEKDLNTSHTLVYYKNDRVYSFQQRDIDPAGNIFDISFEDAKKVIDKNSCKKLFK